MERPKVKNDGQFRPSSPKEWISYLQETIDMSDKTIVANIDWGTGVFTKLFLDYGNPVFAVESNAEMRKVAD